MTTTQFNVKILTSCSGGGVTVSTVTAVWMAATDMCLKVVLITVLVVANRTGKLLYSCVHGYVST